MKTLTYALGLLLCTSVWSKTYVTVENETSLRLTLKTTQSGSPLSREHWAQLAYEVEPGQKRKVLQFNRDSGIKNGRGYLFTTKVSPEVNLLQLVRGKFINSQMWQSISSGPRKLVWNDTRDEKNIGAIIDGRPVRITYKAVSAGTDDDIVYRFTELSNKELEGEENKLTLLNYNIYMRPISMFKNGQLIRARLLPEVLGGNDVINFSEAFDDDALNILFDGLKKEYPFRTKVVGSDRAFEQDGGVVIVSRWPIMEEDELRFGSLCHKVFEDCLSDKGVGYAKVLKGTKAYHIFATHLQAGYTQKDKQVRREQLHKLKQFVDSKHIPETEPVIYTGDFNVHFMDLEESEPDFDLLEIFDEVVLANLGVDPANKFKNNYALMLEILKAHGLPHSGHRFSFDPTTNELAKKSEPPELVEHIMVSRGHRLPVSASQQVLKVKSGTSWREYSWENEIRDLSDHYPVRAELQF